MCASCSTRLLPVVAITGSSIMVGCSGYSGSRGSYGSYGSYGALAAAGAHTHRAARPRSANATPVTGSYAGCAAPNLGADGIYRVFFQEHKMEVINDRATDRYMYALMAQISQTAACNRCHDTEPRLARWLLISREQVF